MKSSTLSRDGAVRLGLVGCGLWGVKLLADALELGAWVCVADPSPEARENAARLGAAVVRHDARELPEVDAFIVSTPASTHFEVISEVLLRGVPIFTEKPFTLELEQAEELVRIAEDRIFVLHTWRHHPAVRVLRQILRAGTLGQPEWLRTFRTNWTSPRTDCDPVWTLLPHDFSIFLEMLGDLPPLAYARAERSGGDVVGLLAVLEGEFPCVAEVSTRYADKRREIRLHGSDGVAVFPGDEAGEVLVYRGAAGSERPTPERILIGGMTALQHELAAVLAYLRGGPAPASIARDALRIARLVHETRRMAGIER